MKPIERPFYYNASPEMLKRADDLRKNMTQAESALWEIIGKKKLIGVTFRRQHPITKFVVDFYCHEVLLVVEVDGGVHNTKDVAEHDEGREHELKKLGLNILRFSNNEVLGYWDKVVKSIQLFIKEYGVSFPLGKDKR
jgi:very-short-patch-repair endonuclease